MAVEAKEMIAEAEQRTEAIRLEKEALQQQYAKDKAEWERKNTQLIEEVGQLHEEKKRNAAKEGFVIIGVPSMRDFKNEALESLKSELAVKSRTMVYGQKLSRLELFRGPRHKVLGTQFRSPKELSREEVRDLVDNRTYDSGVFVVSRVI
ncbi:hypothetical protein R1flu_025791 [Riccia fluitans]|uniref:Uncharacterized protein n=1 Tax=Riccia fluitans TaxID=41844 RepID=A0ABD1XZ67_9MARC